MENQKSTQQLAKEAREWVASPEGQAAIENAHRQAKAVLDELNNPQKEMKLRQDLEFYSYAAGLVSLG